MIKMDFAVFSFHITSNIRGRNSSAKLEYNGGIYRNGWKLLGIGWLLDGKGILELDEGGWKGIVCSGRVDEKPSSMVG